MLRIDNVATNIKISYSPTETTPNPTNPTADTIAQEIAGICTDFSDGAITAVLSPNSTPGNARLFGLLLGMLLLRRLHTSKQQTTQCE